ncbi:MAG: DNA topoisomerase 3 [Desulfovibrio sp.]|nr:DNA topoisomerase 3 [Desulfovibrio sp.]
MRVFIAEKPSLGRAIADGLGGGQKKAGFIACGRDIVTWCFGHLFELASPEAYDSAYKKWDRAVLPIIPGAWKVGPRSDVAEQIKVVGELLSKADSVVNAGDPDREGQLIVDEVLEHFHFRGKVERIWLASLDARSVAKALSSLTDNAKHAPLRDAALARSRADWLVGLNATRAITLLGRESGLDGVLSLGRVQTPTLNLVVTRDREIAAFKPKDYFTLKARFEHPSGAFSGVFKPSDEQPGLDSDGRLTDAAVVNSLLQNVRGKTGSIKAVTREKKKKAPPLPHCLSSLQKAASARLNMTAQEVLDTAQKLYENKLTTYPRTDCRYLPVEQFEDASRILMLLHCVPGLEQTAANADGKLKSEAWNTNKITAHHAIIPTGEILDLSGNERAIFQMIAEAYCLQFYPPLQYESQKISVTVDNTIWEARGRMILDAGWTSCARDDDEEEKEDRELSQSLPAVMEGDAVTCADVEKLAKKTTPPPKWTEGTLIEAMANVHRFVADAAAKATLKENEGIGTEATRAGILETLKKRGYLKAQGKALVSTDLAWQVMDLTPPVLKDPVTTAQWESKLENIAKGTFSLESFMAEQVRALPDMIAPLLSGEALRIRGVRVFPCPVCGKAMQKKNGAHGLFWSCTAYPECKTSLPDDKGKPGERKSTAKDSGHVCPDCGKPLRVLRKTSKAGKPYELFSCSGYPHCKSSFFGKGGKPDFNARPGK